MDRTKSSNELHKKIVRDSDSDNAVAANAVIAKIAALPAKNDVTIANKTAIDEARKAYDLLTPAQKALVTNLSKLTDAEAKIAELELAEADLQSAKTTIEGLTFTNLEVADISDNTHKKAAVEAVINGATLPTGVTFEVSADGTTVTLSKTGATNVVITTNATFVLTADAQATADANAFKATHTAVLGKTVATVVVDDESAVDDAITALGVLSNEAKAKLTDEETLLGNLKDTIVALKALDVEVAKITKAAIEGSGLNTNENVLTKAQALVSTGYTVTIKSTSNSAISELGVVTKPASSASDVTGDVIFTVSKDGKTKEVTVSLTVVKEV